MLGTAISILAGLAALWGVFTSTRQRASRSGQARRMLLLRTSLGIATGLVLAFVVPSFVAETPGSPASLVVLIVLWAMGGVLIALGLAAWAGAWRADPD